MKLDLQKVQSKILQELDEVMKFKQDFDLLSNTMEWRKDSNREKRNAIDRSKQIKNSDPSTNELTKTDRSSSKFNNFSSTSIGTFLFLGVQSLSLPKYLLIPACFLHHFLIFLIQANFALQKKTVTYRK